MCTVWPPARNAVAKPSMASVSPSAWWKTTTSANAAEHMHSPARAFRFAPSASMPVGMPSPTSTHRFGGAARTGVIGTVVAAVAFFDGVFLGAPIALLAASFRSLLVSGVATVAVVLLVIACCAWIDRRWDDWFSGNGKRLEARLETMRASRLMKHPVAWIQRGSDRWYACAAALANPILVGAFARAGGGRPIGERRILLGAVAYAVPYVAMWSLVGLALGDTIRAA